MRPGRQWCSGSAQWGLAGVGLWRLCPMRPGWCWYRSSARWSLVSVIIEALPNETLWELIWKLCLMRLSKRWCKASTQYAIVSINVKTLLNKLSKYWCKDSTQWSLINVSIKFLLNKAWQALVYKSFTQWGLIGISKKALSNEAWLKPVQLLCLIKPGWHWCGNSGRIVVDVQVLIAKTWLTLMRKFSLIKLGANALSNEVWHISFTWWNLV